MTKCPECGAKLGAGMFKCRCGWIASSGPAKRADCAVAGCGALTSVREKTETGWANFCEYHYVEYHHRKSEKHVREELGLKSVEEMKEFCGRRVRGILRSVRSGDVVQREPGQDDEEVREGAEIDF